MSREIHVCSECGEEYAAPGAPGCDCGDKLMRSGRIFNFDFIQEMRQYLMDKTVEGHCVTRTQLCKDLELDPKLDSVIGAIINLGHMPGFRIYMGPNGGIGRTDLKPPTKSRGANGYAPILDDQEAAKILAKLEELCGNGQIVPRKRVAVALGKPGTKMETLISAALKRPEFSDFATKNGKGGGVYKVSARPDIVRRAARVKAAVTAPDEPKAPEVSQPISEVEKAPTEPAPAPEEPAQVSEEVDPSDPFDQTFEEQLKEQLKDIKSPIKRRLAYNKAVAEKKSA